MSRVCTGDCGSQGVNLERTQTIKYISFELSLGLGLIAWFVNDPRVLEVLAGLPRGPGTSRGWVSNRSKQSLAEP